MKKIITLILITLTFSQVVNAQLKRWTMETCSTTKNYSTASGYDSTASGYGSTTSGYHSTASGYSSTASGTYSTASGSHSTASGYSSIASGYSSIASGRRSIARSYGEVVFGRYNIESSTGHENTWDSNDALFRLGNGSDSSHRSDAVMIEKSGKIHSLGNYPLSDIRLKYKIKQIQNPLTKILKLRGVYYNWKPEQWITKGTQREIGLIAQEVEKVVPELVSTDKDPDSKGRYLKSVAYEKTVALLIEGIKEQQKEIESLKKEIEELKEKNNLK